MKKLKKQWKYIRFLITPMWKYGKAYLVLSLISNAVFQPISSVASALLPQKAIDSVMRQDATTQTLLIVALYSSVMIVIYVTQNIISSIFQNVAQNKLSMEISNEVNTKAIETDFKYYDNPEFFTMFTYAQQSYAQGVQNMSWALPQFIQCIVTVVAMGAIIMQAGPILIVISLAFVLVQTVLTIPQMKMNADFNVKATEMFRPIQYVSRIMQQKENSAELRSSRMGRMVVNAYRRSYDIYTKSIRKYYSKMLKFTIPQTILNPIQSAFILLYIIIFVIDGDITKIGLYASLSTAASTLSVYIQNLFSNYTNLFQNTLAAERIARFFEAESVIEPPREDATPAPDGEYAVELRDVSFGYENAAFAIEHLNLKIPAGQRVAIVGENGAGKSTLTKLLLRLYDVNDGALLINGTDIRDYDIHDLRRHIGIAYQDVRILAMSLRDNLTAYNDATDEELVALMERIGLDGVLKKVDGDLDRMVSREFTEDGAVLSGGEAQRLSLARLFIGEFGLLLLDEPSSALDPLAEYKLMQLILDKSNTATTIMVAHRLSTVRDFDVIYHIENGAVIESGTHDELMAAHGKYYEMFTRQAENYLDAEEETAAEVEVK